MGDKIKSTVLFEPGYNGSSYYRIPSLITTMKGTLLAGIDIRWSGSNDNPNSIGLGIRRSTDHGESWEEIRIVVDYPREGLDGPAALDSSLLQDQVSGTIWMIFTHTPGGIGLWNSEPGTGFNPEKYKRLQDQAGNPYTLHPNGAVYTEEGQPTDYRVTNEGDVYLGDERLGHIYAKKGRAHIDSRCLYVERTSFLQAVKSDDDGCTWSEPIDLNPQVKQSWMRFIGAGPGRGIQMSNPNYMDRLVFPIYFSNEHYKLSNAVMYSDDHGQTWQLGASLNDGRIHNGERLSAKTITEQSAELTESQVVELPDGQLLLLSRNHSGKQRTLMAKSSNGGESWHSLHFHEDLLDPTSQSSALAYSDEVRGNMLIFANPAHPTERVNGTIKISIDQGKTWPYRKQIQPNAYGYNCLTVLHTGEIGVLYEGEGGKVSFTKQSLKSLLQDA